jgi:hypothetical protein
MNVAGNNSTYELGALGNHPITFSFEAMGPTATLQLAPALPNHPVPAPPAALLLGSGLIYLAISRGKVRGLSNLLSIPQS